MLLLFYIKTKWYKFKGYTTHIGASKKLLAVVKLTIITETEMNKYVPGCRKGLKRVGFKF